jgi:hypothetical protein
LLSTAPALAGDARNEISKRVTVHGAKLPASSDLVFSRRPGDRQTVPTISGKSFDGSKVTYAGDGTPRLPPVRPRTGARTASARCRPREAGQEGQARRHPGAGRLDERRLEPAELAAVGVAQDEHWPFTPVLAATPRVRALTAFGGESFPFFVFVDADGKVVARASGELSPSSSPRPSRTSPQGSPCSGDVMFG